MATLMVPVPAKTWTLISSESIGFQIPEQSSAWMIEAGSAPSDLSIRMKLLPTKLHFFNKVDGNLYIYSDVSIEVAIFPTGA